MLGVRLQFLKLKMLLLWVLGLRLILLVIHITTLDTNEFRLDMLHDIQ